MKINLPIFFAIIFFTQVTFAQKKIELINSGDLISKAGTLYDSSRYKDALVLLNKISRSDTNYVWSLYEKAINCEADSQYSLALQYCREGISLKEQRDHEADLYNSYGNILNEMGQKAEAIKVFDQAIAKYPSYSLYYFNKGIVYSDMKRPAEAEAMFKKTLLINPYLYSAHFQLGYVALQQGKIIPAFLSFIGYLLVNPEGKYCRQCIGFLDHIANGSDDILKIKNDRKVTPDASYQAVEDIVFSKLALDKSYKPIISLDDPISRQIQAVFEKMSYNSADSDFWNQYYIPFFEKVYKDGKFEVFINHIFSIANIDAIQNYLKAHQKQKTELINEAQAYFDLIRFTRQLNYPARDTVSVKYIFKEGELIGRGAITSNNKQLIGYCEGYYPAGNLKSKGNYNASGKLDGRWIYYFESGQLKAIENYADGKQQGEQDYYFDNGNHSSTEHYNDNTLDGLTTTYFYGGNIKSTTNYAAGKKEGEERDYYANGNLYGIYNYTDGQFNGTIREYYKSGGIKNVQQYLNGKLEGPYKTYYENGQLSSEGMMNKNKATGEWKFYYKNGKLKQQRTYRNDNENGLHQEYFDNGQISYSCTEKDGKTDGVATYYYKDGKILAKYEYDNGKIKSINYYSEAGALLSKAKQLDTLMDVVSYNTDGIKSAHYLIDADGKTQGVDSVFYASGKLDQVNQCKNDQFDGLSTTYYLNGNKKNEVGMANGEDDGLLTDYYPSGKIGDEGWMKNGQKQGEWVHYDELGRLTERSNFLDDDLDGYKDEFSPNGKKFREEKYYRGWLLRVTQYDTTGKVIRVDSFPKETGKYILIYPNGQKKAEANYVNGDFDGAYKTYYFDGSLESVYYYKKGALDSTYTAYNYGGTKNSEGHYKNGNKTGLWKYYTEEGKLYATGIYKDDQLNGNYTFYNDNGSKDFISPYKDDELNGVAKKFGQDGTLAYQITYKDGFAVSYTYLDKNGKLLPDIKIAAQNGILKAYYPNGKLARVCHFSDGIRNGTDTVYYTNGQVRSVDSTYYSVYSGVSKKFYLNGKLKSAYHYLNDNLTGISREYTDKGILKEEVHYDNDNKTGPAKYYNANGKLIKTLIYYYGTIIGVKHE